MIVIVFIQLNTCLFSRLIYMVTSKIVNYLLLLTCYIMCSQTQYHLKYRKDRQNFFHIYEINKLKKKKGSLQRNEEAIRK